MKTIKTYWPLKYWETGEWQVVEERLRDAEGTYCPGHGGVFNALRIVPLECLRVCFIAQDPYPNPQFACGLAFSVPRTVPVTFSNLPPTLLNLYEEYEKDTHLPVPEHGDLSAWCKQGVLLWNAIPTCHINRSLSHDWEEWTYLTKEIVAKATELGCPCVFFGGVARRFATDAKGTIEVSHPSPRASAASRLPFFGSRIFTRVNDYLCGQKRPPIDWRL